MVNITTFEILDDQIRKAGGKPVVLEALWDGDTNGWFLSLFLYVETGVFTKKRTRHFLGYIALANDLRVFTGGQWTESGLACEFGKEAVKKYNLEFYFPSDKEPDNDCPAWTERHLAIRCKDCNKLIILADSPYLPRDICYNCHLKRERKEKIINNDFIQEGVVLYLSNAGQSEWIGFWSAYESVILSKFLILPLDTQDNPLTVFTLKKDDLTALKEDILNALIPELDRYEKPVMDETERRFSKSVYEIEYEGRKYELETRFNKSHHDILEYTEGLTCINKALTGNYELNICFIRGLKYRDDLILRHLNYTKETVDINSITEFYKDLLSEVDVVETLRRLEGFGCLTMLNTEIVVTDLGRNIV